MYFDFHYYFKVLAFTWSQKQWPGRNKTLLRLLLVVPLVTIFHTLCFLLDYIFFPRLFWQEVKEPIFVVGHARSGTTLMHRLLAADGERFSYFVYWEMFLPALTQRYLVRFIGFIDAKLLRSSIEKKLQAWDEKTFGKTRHIHNMGLWVPEEDQFVMNTAFVTQQWSLTLPLMHEIDIFHIDELSEKRKRKWMNHYKRCVRRQLLINGGNKTHLSKNPLMSGWVNALLETFPDAKIITMVRDPIECIPSTLKLVELAWKMRKWKPEDYAESLETLTAISFDSYRLPKQALEARPHIAHYFVDYRELISEPKATLEKTYAAIGLDITSDYQHYLENQQNKERAHKSNFDYKLEDYSITAETIETELDEFYEQYKWPRPSAIQAMNQQQETSSD
jgi:hypothetical protein